MIFPLILILLPIPFATFSLMARNLGDNAVADEYQNLETIAEREMHQMYNG